MWDDLDIQQKSELMRLFIKNNIYSLDKMKEIYNDTTERQYSSGGPIHIDPSKRGTFKAQASRMGMTVQEAASHILANKGNYSPAMIKKANFARNFAHADGGNLFFTGGPFATDPPTYNFGLPLATGTAGAWGDAKQTEADKQFEKEFKEAQEKYQKQQAQDIIKSITESKPNIPIVPNITSIRIQPKNIADKTVNNNNSIVPYKILQYEIDENSKNYNEQKEIDKFLKDQNSGYFYSEGFKNKVKKFPPKIREQYLDNVKYKLLDDLYHHLQLYMDNYGKGSVHNYVDNTIHYDPLQARELNTTFGQVYAHERGHSLDPNGSEHGYIFDIDDNSEFNLKYAPSKEILNVLKQYKFNNKRTEELFDETPFNIYNGKYLKPETKQKYNDEFIYKNDLNTKKELHDRNYSEIYADYISIIYDLYKLGLWDARNTKPFTRDIYRKYKEYNRKHGLWNRALKNMDENTFIQMMNTFAYNDSNNNNNSKNISYLDTYLT